MGASQRLHPAPGCRPPARRGRWPSAPAVRRPAGAQPLRGRRCVQAHPSLPTAPKCRKVADLIRGHAAELWVGAAFWYLEQARQLCMEDEEASSSGSSGDLSEEARQQCELGVGLCVRAGMGLCEKLLACSAGCACLQACESSLGHGFLAAGRRLGGCRVASQGRSAPLCAAKREAWWLASAPQGGCLRRQATARGRPPRPRLATCGSSTTTSASEWKALRWGCWGLQGCFPRWHLEPVL